MIEQFISMVKNWSTIIERFLFRPVPSQQLGIFRIFFGLCIVYEIIYYYKIDILNRGLRAPALLFPYEGLEWITLLPGKTMEAIQVLLLLSSVCILLGVVYRIAIVTFFAGFSYIFFIDKSLYNNHLYLFVLLSFLLIFSNADSAYSVNKRKKLNTVPYWQIFIIKIQMFIVYFYGGLVKLNYDWLVNRQPVKSIINYSATKSDFLEYSLVYGGVLFDLCIGFLLWNKRTRLFGVIGVVIFNLTNATIFNDIGVFPFFMILATIVFFEPETVRSFTAGMNPGQKKNKDQEQPAIEIRTQVKTMLIITYILFQFLFPFRYILFPGNVDWYGVGQRFSWRMKIQNRQIQEMNFIIMDKSNNRQFDADPSKFITQAQILSLSQDPKMIYQFAKFLDKESAKSGIVNKSIHANIKVAFNGRMPQYIVDPKTNLIKINYNKFNLLSWVLPLEK